MASIPSNLQQASYNGVPFGVDDEECRFGRRQALHEYPKRDKPWAEDMGRATRRMAVNGFLMVSGVYNGGGDAMFQRDQLVAAVETPGPGTLVHPTLGTLTVSVFDLTIRSRTEDGYGTYFSFSLTFIEGGDRLFPTLAVGFSSATPAAAADATAATANTFTAKAKGFLAQGQEVIQKVMDTVRPYVNEARALANDAISIANIPNSLIGSLGRFTGIRIPLIGAGRGGILGGLSRVTNLASANGAALSGAVNSAIAGASAARASVTRAGDALSKAAGDLGL